MRQPSFGIGQADTQLGCQLATVKGHILVLHHLVQRFEGTLGGNKARLLLTRHQIEVLGRIALDATYHLDLGILLPRVETLDQFLKALGAFFVELMRKLDFCRCRSRQ